MGTLADLLAQAAGNRTRMQPWMTGQIAGMPAGNPQVDPPALGVDFMRMLEPDPATQWMQNRPAIRPPPPTPPGEGNLTTMQRRLAY